jgi:Mn2+/Fe2+ NRAMP family transporter
MKPREKVMLLDEQRSSQRLATQKTLFTLWMLIAALAVVATMMAGLATSAHAASDPLQLAGGALAPTLASGVDDSTRTVLMALMMLTFSLMAIGTFGLARRSLKDLAKATSRKHRR